ncbi:MAG: hypothetical protein GY830_00185 [Bacteroidetes bacterium]|nr:hypothetical protein [Bacteroidota bacterium]
MIQTWDKKSIREHYSHLSKEEIIDNIIGLGSEGKNLINVLNQKELAKILDGEFVGDKINDHDIVVNNIKLELKCNVNQATDLGKTVGFAEFLQKKDWDYIIHYTPKAFNTYLNEDKFVLFNKLDIKKALKEKWIAPSSGGLRWTYKIFDPNHKITNAGGHRKKLEFIKSRIINFQELYNLIWK